MKRKFVNVLENLPHHHQFGMDLERWKDLLYTHLAMKGGKIYMSMFHSKDVSQEIL